MSEMAGTTIKPDDFDDFYAVGCRTGTKQDLSCRQFLTHCPPDVPPRHRILALLGVTDIADMAKPQEDGWFVSDFYLFHYLFSQPFPSQTQIWMTCEKPEDLVAKYQEYLHGSSRHTRRVVLDRARLPDISAAGNIRHVQRKDLVERYLSTLGAEAAEATRNQEHLMLLIFAHGTEAHGLEVGDSILQIKDLVRSLQGKSNVTLFSTSCYSGGWLVRPDLNNVQLQPAPPRLDTTALLSAGPETVSYSWPACTSAGKVSGSLAATALLNSFLDAEDEIAQDGDHPTYIQLAKSVYDHMKTMGLTGEAQEIYFSADNDEWETSYQARLGLPLAAYRDKWSSLRQVPPSSAPSSGLEVARAGGRRHKRLQFLAREYFAAKPGVDSASPNVSLHYCLRSIFKGETYTKEKMDHLIETTAYRLGSMHEANYLKDQLGLDFPSVFEIDTFPGFIAKTWDPEIYSKTWHLLLQRNIITKPIGIRFFYSKPLEYLTIVLVKSSTSWEQIQELVEVMAAKKKGWYRFIYKAWLGNRVASDEGLMKNARAFKEAMEKIRHQSQQLSD
ncbi:hypothetical protein N7461_000126 [Penicillium sp. DV-2018c]|nr:hypothetical protein N7461_000126 [Penicillium sp. DV-2018c]